jgi:hypothetical protein
MDRIGFLSVPFHTPETQALFDDDLTELGYVMNVSRLWSYQPTTVAELFELMGRSLTGSGLSARQRGILKGHGRLGTQGCARSQRNFRGRSPDVA